MNTTTTTNRIHNFTEEQYDAFQEILNFCNTPFGGIYLVTGVAGTGKTYLTTKIVTELKAENILVTAPTHKAVKVLQSECNINFHKVKFATVHSALGLREKIDGHGTVTFEPEPNAQHKIEKANYMIVDEASMLHDQLFDMLAKYVEKHNLKIIMVGDPVQIPPIGKKDSKPFQHKYQLLYKIKISELKSIVRQSIGHPIIEKSFEVRTRINEPRPFVNRDNLESPVGSVFFCGKENLKDMFSDYFDSYDFNKNVDYARVIAWTNATVNDYNALIRSIIYKRNYLPKIVIGEKLIIDSPIVKNDKVVFNTNDEVEVVGYKICKEEVKGLDRFIKYYDTVVKYETTFFGNMHHNIKIVHEDSEPEFEEICDMVKQVALQEKQGSNQAKMYWIMYYHLKNYFAQVKYSYSITVHKSQGSTYLHAFIDETDILKNPDIVERNRILYTAITRAKKNVYIIK